MPVTLCPYEKCYGSDILRLSLRAWDPVFAQLEASVPSFVYRAFYPEGWEARQTADIESFLADEHERVWVAVDRNVVVGWIGVRLHPEDSMGEVYILAVDPDRQRQGVASALLERAADHMREADMKIVMVETGGDPGHAASRATYELNGFERWPVARYFRKL